MDPDCDSKTVHWSKGKGVAVTIFLPWVAIAKTLGELAHLECWVAKQANLTTDALTNLLSDEETTRQATLQNRAPLTIYYSYTATGVKISTTHSPTINRLQAPSRGLEDDIELELEERPVTPEDEDGRNPDLEEHGLGYPTQHEWFAESYPQSEYLPPPFQFWSF
ncbi:hypothetical protein DUI87_03970 [Hirundo rustica rustica]|uniref:Uncharacterized protein n=1 Tax=Hirundo rustica rustica TaxID=333673 RepID=A0A3M0L2W0_HIRRU|nr:hypothetical protein DUI87_03970 [Hirundo rustica rustica]